MLYGASQPLYSTDARQRPVSTFEQTSFPRAHPKWHVTTVLLQWCAYYARHASLRCLHSFRGPLKADNPYKSDKVQGLRDAG